MTGPVASTPDLRERGWSWRQPGGCRRRPPGLDASRSPYDHFVRRTLSDRRSARQHQAGGLSRMLVGYMQASSTDERQSTDLQRDALVRTGVNERHLHTDRASGVRDNRPGLAACLGFLRAVDTLVVWKLGRLGRSLPHLPAIVGGLKERDVAFRSLTEHMDTASSHQQGLTARQAYWSDRLPLGVEQARRSQGHNPRALPFPPSLLPSEVGGASVSRFYPQAGNTSHRTSI